MSSGVDSFALRRKADADNGKRLPKSEESGETRIVQLGGEGQAWRFCSNFVRTSKYTPLSFVPLFLYQAFHPRMHAANSFFLVICAMQCIPYITYTAVVSLNGIEVGTPTTLLPLWVVVSVDAIFAAMEDMSRHRADKEANNSQTRIVDPLTGKVESIPWRQVRVGDIVIVKNREVVPADLIVLNVAAQAESDNSDGVCYVETKSLDGETNLKQRRAVKEARARCTVNHEHIWNLDGLKGGSIEMEQPNDLIQKFEAALIFSEDFGDSKATRCAVTTENVYLRGCAVRSVDYIAGIAVNTGPDTKIMKSNKEPPVKESSLVGKINRLLKYIICLLIIVCSIGALVSATWLRSTQGHDAWYLGYPRVDSRWGDKTRRSDQATTSNVEEDWYIKFFYYFLLLAQFVPVSLYVSMSMTKNFQSLFLEWDINMYHEESDTPAKVKTMALNEELGQISHIFSDKTGTLTCNVMDFRKCSIDGVSYGRGITAIGAAALKRKKEPIPEEALRANEMARTTAVPHVSFYDPNIKNHLQEDDAHATKICEFFRLLAICHTVLIETSSNTTTNKKQIRYSASSPDDEALVCGAKFFGFSFTDRSAGLMTIHNEAMDCDETYEVIEMLDFNSDRKRMSVICRRVLDESDDNEDIIIYTKGADTVMETRLAPGQDELRESTFGHMVSFSAEGLRTLVCAQATLDRTKFEQWLADYRAASSDLEQIRKRQSHAPNRIDELMDQAENAFGQGLHLLGATAIEDRLQDGVPETIHNLLNAGVKIWVLTGDKQETAINIGVACQLIEPADTMEQIVINAQYFAPVADAAAVKARKAAEAKIDRGESLPALSTPSTASTHNTHELIARYERRARQQAAKLALAALFEREALKLAKQLQQYRQGKQKHPPKPRALVIDGESLLVALEPDDADTFGEDLLLDSKTVHSALDLSQRHGGNDEENAYPMPKRTSSADSTNTSASTQVPKARFEQPKCRQALLQLAKHCKAVVGCRVSPIQKRLMVELVRYGGKMTAEEAAGDAALRRTRTLAIGDGANDVPMIQGAHVGIGISGQEGMQAVNNSDYAIAQFCYLQRLMLVHGRWNYRRTSKLVSHIFYKNVLQGMLTFWFATQTQMSGTKFIVEYAASTVYAVFYTAIPVILLGVLDQDVSAETALAHPELYRFGAVDTYFNRPIFVAWIIEGFFESFLAVYLPFLCINPSLSPGHADGYEFTLWDVGAASFTIIVVIANTKLMLNQYRFTWLDAVSYFISIGSWFLLGTIYGLIQPGGLGGGYPEWEWYYVFPRLLGNHQFWLCVILAILIVFVRDFAWKAYIHMCHPQLYHVYAEQQCLAECKGKQQGPPDTTSTPMHSMSTNSNGNLNTSSKPQLDASLLDVPAPHELILSAIDPELEEPDDDNTSSDDSGIELASRPSALASAERLTYDAQRPNLAPRSGDRLDHQLGYAFSTDAPSHAAEIMQAKSKRAFSQYVTIFFYTFFICAFSRSLGPAVDADAYRRSELLSDRPEVKTPSRSV